MRFLQFRLDGAAPESPVVFAAREGVAGLGCDDTAVDIECGDSSRSSGRFVSAVETGG